MWGTRVCARTPHGGLKIEAPDAQIGVRAHAQFSEPGPEFCELHPGAAPCKNHHQTKIPPGTSGYRDRGSIANIDSHPTAKMADSNSPVTLRTRKFIRNPLLGRKQMVV